jgi:cytochrome c553
MIKKLLTVSISLAIVSASAVVFAEGSAKLGKTQAASCAGCHGEDGNSMVSTFPKLAGQHELYLANQLQAFKLGSRNAPMMAPLAMALSDEEMQNIGAYYAEQKISANQMPVLQADEDEDEDDLSEEEQKAAAEKRKDQLKELMAIGGDLYRNGDLEREVSACIACHGPYGEGNKPAAFPALYSQHADYLIKSLIDYKKGARQNNPENMMHMIATKMTDKQIKAVSYYISMMK